MKPQSNGSRRVHNHTREEGPTWLIIAAAGALLSTLSIRLGYKLKQVTDSKPKQNAATTILKGTYHLVLCFVYHFLFV